MTKRISALRAKYLNKLTLQRPKQIHETDWRIFVAVVSEGRTIRDISRETGLSVFKLNHVVLQVDEELDPSGTSAKEKTRITLDSPLEDLNLSTRSRNTLRKIGCDTVRSILRKDFTRAVRSFGAATRQEVALVLSSHGFAAPPALESLQLSVETLARELGRLRLHLEQAHRLALDQLTRLEDSVLKLSNGSPEPTSGSDKGLCMPRAERRLAKASRTANGGPADQSLEF